MTLKTTNMFSPNRATQVILAVGLIRVSAGSYSFVPVNFIVTDFTTGICLLQYTHLTRPMVMHSMRR